MNDESKRAIVFNNEHFVETYVKRDENEPQEARDERGSYHF